MALLAAGPVATAMDELRDPMSHFAEDLEAETKTQPGDVTGHETGRREVWDKHAETIITLQREIELRMREDLRTPE